MGSPSGGNCSDVWTAMAWLEGTVAGQGGRLSRAGRQRSKVRTREEEFQGLRRGGGTLRAHCHCHTEVDGRGASEGRGCDLAGDAACPGQDRSRA